MPNKGELIAHDLRRLPPTISQQLRNKKHEIFCRFVAGGATYVDAHEMAGYNRSTANASTLANRVEVQDRIAILKQEAEDKEADFKLKLIEAGKDHLDPDGSRQLVAVQCVDDVRRLIAENARLAQIAGEYKAANEALKMLADSFGMFSNVNTGKESGKSPGPQVSLTLINQALEQIEGGSGDMSPETGNPLAPRISETGRSKR